MNFYIFLLEGITFPLILITLTILFAWSAPKFVIARQLLFVTLVPLMLFAAYLVFGYQTEIWFIFGRYSWAPYLIAAAAFLVSFGVVLARASVPLYSKAILAAVTIVSWAIFLFITTFFTVCIMGDCL
jgi:hypothetical protein